MAKMGPSLKIREPVQSASSEYVPVPPGGTWFTTPSPSLLATVAAKTVSVPLPWKRMYSTMAFGTQVPPIHVCPDAANTYIPFKLLVRHGGAMSSARAEPEPSDPSRSADKTAAPAPLFIR